MPRAKCPICSQSTETSDGSCEFCGCELGSAILAEAADRAKRLAAPASRDGGRAIGEEAGLRAAVRPGSVAAVIETPKELREAEQMAATSFALALVSIFLIPLVAPIAHRLGRNSLRIYEAHGVPPHWTASTGYWIGLVVSLLIVFALLTVLAVLGLPLLFGA